MKIRSAHLELVRELARRFNHIYGKEVGFEEKAKAAIKKLGSKRSKRYESLRTAFQEQGDDGALEAARDMLDAAQNLALGDRERLFGYLEGSRRMILPEPQPLLTEASKVPGLDGQKMSKSYDNAIFLREDPASITTKIRTMQTDPARVRRSDPGNPANCPVWPLHQMYSDQPTQEWVQQGCTTAGIGCLECKQPVIDAIIAEQVPFHERAQKYLDDPSLVRAIVADGCERAKQARRGNHARGPRGHGLELHVSKATAVAPVIDLAQAAGAPVARIYGEPLLEMPHDLYIPPEALEVFLETFEGPLDLLLYLIRKQNINVLDIPMAELTRQYLGYVEMMRRTQLELAAEYLLMAAVLIEIKSRLLLPKPPPLSGEEVEDPRAELVRRLLEYERMKAGARALDELPLAERDFSLVRVWFDRVAAARLPEVNPDDLKAAWAVLVARARANRHHLVSREQLSVRSQMSRLLKLLEPGRFVEFLALFEERVDVPRLVVTFLAILELARERLLDIAQAAPYAPIYVQRKGDPAFNLEADAAA